MSEDLRHILQTQSRKICRYKMFLSDFSPYDYYFISRTHTEPMILGGVLLCMHSRSISVH